MNKHYFKAAAVIFCAAFAGLFASCTKFYGDPTTEHYTLNGSYTKIDISNAFDVTVSPGVSDAVVTLPEDLHSKLKLKIKDGTLYIGFTNGWFVTANECTVVLPVNMQLADLDLSGASSFYGNLQGASSEVEISGASEFHGNITAATVDMEISGASNYKGTVNCDEADVDLSGASEATIEGACTNTMDINVSGTSGLNAASFNTDAVTGWLSGASKADVTVCNRIAVNVSGASRLTYGTSSTSCRPTYGCTTSGSSSVSPR